MKKSTIIFKVVFYSVAVGLLLWGTFEGNWGTIFLSFVVAACGTDDFEDKEERK